MQDNKTIALAFFDALANRDAEGLDAIMHPELEWWMSGSSPISGDMDRARFVAAVQILWQIMDGPCAISFSAITAEEDRVALAGVGDMRTTQGVPYCNRYHILMRIKDGKVFRGSEYFDTELVTRVFGGG